jgi:hypothetical protein
MSNNSNNSNKNNNSKNSSFKGEEKRRGINIRFRKGIDENVGRLKTLHSVLHHAQAQHLPQSTICKVEMSCLQLEDELIKMGLPKCRLQKIVREVV